MTDEPEAEDPHAAPSEPKEHKGRGCFLGGLTVVTAVLGSFVVGAFAQTEVFTCKFECYSAFALITPLLLIALLVGAGLLWRKTPGFLLGIGATIGLSLAIGTACAALIAR